MSNSNTKTFCDICGEELKTWPNKFETSFYKLSSVCDTCSRNIDHTIERLNKGHPEIKLPTPDIPTSEKIGEAYREHCRHVLCESCIFSGSGNCETNYAYLLFTGKMSLTDSFNREEQRRNPDDP